MRRSLLCTCVCAGLWTSGPASAAETLLLEVSINGHSIGGITQVDQLDDGSLVLDAEAWTRARIKPAASALTLPDGRTVYALQSVPGLEFKLDRSRLTLAVTAPVGAFETLTTDIHHRVGVEAQRPLPGAYLNYDLFATHASDGGSGEGALIEAVAFNGQGSFVTGMAWRSDAHGSDAFRTDSYWRRDVPGRMQTWVVGDTISSTGGWSRPVRYGGVRFARDFATAPGYVTYPMPSISGSAAIPSTVEVLVNNQRSASADVPAGPFELTNVPIVGGAGEMQLVVRDVLGRETMISQSYYIAPQLLAAGLSDFSYEAGLMREGYGSRKDHYDRAFAAGSYRRGLSDRITGEMRVEADQSRAAAGFAVTAIIARLGVLGIAAGWSDSNGRRGGHYVATAQRTSPKGGASLSWSHFDRDYTEFGAFGDEPHARDQVTASAGGRLGQRLTGGVNYTRQSEWNGRTFNLVSTSIGMQFRAGAFLSLSAGKRLDEDRSWTAGLNFVMPLGQRRLLAASSTRQANGELASTLQFGQSPPTGPGFGWRISAIDDGARRLRAESVFNGKLGQATADAELGSGSNALRLGANGSIGRLGGLSFASRRIDHGAFAVVQVPGIPGVGVFLSNQLVARTNAKGLALVTGLLPYQRNVLSLDPDQLPLDTQIDSVVATAVPYARSGSSIRFPVRRSRNALVVLMQSDGAPVPAGARVSLGPGLAEFSVALRGEVYLEGIADQNTLSAHWQKGACSVSWQAPDALSQSPARTPLTCEELR